MTRRARRFQTRLLVAMLAIAFGVLVVSTVAAGTLARETAADSAIDDLEQQAPTVARELDTFGERFREVRAQGRTPSGLCRVIAGVLRASGGSVVVVDADGAVREGLGGVFGATCGRRAGASPFPRDVRSGDLDVGLLRAGRTQSGLAGDTAFVARPLPVIGERRPVLVLTQDVERRPLGGAAPFLIGAGAVTLVIAALVSVYLVRRLTRPIAAMEHTAKRIARGDLSARVGLTEPADDELGGLAHSIDAMADELETARGHERAFLLSVSHDLRTPLTSIKGYAEAIADGTADSPEQRARSADVIASEARRLERLVADLLDLARLDAHQFSLAPGPLDVRRVVDEAVAGFLPAAHGWGVRLEVAPGEPVLASADAQRVAQVVANLVENALKYARSSVVVDVVKRDDRVELRVDDDGPGVPADERERVFERLYTARGAPGRQVGTGIGLAVVHELASAMLGTATCEPSPTGGTRFIVTIPA